MESNIQKIKFYDGGLIEITVICPKCKQINVHTITHASSKDKNGTIINFSELGKRSCHGERCYSNYKLY